MIKKIIAAAAAVVVAGSSLILPVSAAGSSVAEPENSFTYSSSDINQSLYSGDYYRSENAYFKDEALVFNDESYYSKFKNSVQRTADEIGMNVGIFLGGNYRSDSTTESFTRNSIIELFTLDPDQNSVFLYLDFPFKTGEQCFTRDLYSDRAFNLIHTSKGTWYSDTLAG